MTETVTAPSSPRVALWTARVTNPRLPLWLRVVAYAEAHAVAGHTVCAPGELRATIDPTVTPSAISRAISTAVTIGWLHPDSHARHLVLRHHGLDQR